MNIEEDSIRSYRENEIEAPRLWIECSVRNAAFGAAVQLYRSVASPAHSCQYRGLYYRPGLDDLSDPQLVNTVRARGPISLLDHITRAANSCRQE